MVMVPAVYATRTDEGTLEVEYPGYVDTYIHAPVDIERYADSGFVTA